MTSGWLALAAAFIGAGTTVYGASQNRRAGKAGQRNFDLYNEAMMLNEEEARELFDQFLAGYYKKKEELGEGLTLQQYIENTVTTLNDPQLTAAYRNARNGDWEQAQRWADEGSEQNISIFNKIVDETSGGDFKNFITARNKAVLGEDIESTYSEAERLRAPKIPAGSIKRDTETGEVIGGQRGDKFDFQTSVTAIKEFRDRSFTKTRTAIEDDRTAAVRQQERAFNFLPQLNYAEFGARISNQFAQNKLAADMAELQIEAGLASRAMASALGAPMAPPATDMTAGNALMESGAKLAAAGIADLYKNRNTNQTTGTTNVGGSTLTSGATDTPAQIKPVANIYA